MNPSFNVSFLAVSCYNFQKIACVVPVHIRVRVQEVVKLVVSIVLLEEW